jgi:hypothetical protein
MITSFFKFIFNIIRLAVLLAVFALIFHTWVIKQILQFSLSWSLGADTYIEAVKMDWKNTGFEVHGLEIKNPSSFSPPGVLADIPLAIVSVDVPAISQGRIHLKTVGINLRELSVIHSPGKGLNVMELKPMKGDASSEEPRTTGGTRQKIEKAMPAVTIDEFIISIGNIVFVETLGGVQKQKIIRIGVQGATYYDINGISDITYLIIAPALRKFGFAFAMDKLGKFGEDYAKTTESGSFWDRLKKAMAS